MNFWPEICRRTLRPLKRACVLNPETLPESTDPDFEFEYIDIGNVTLEAGISGRERTRLADAPSRARKPVRPGDIIVSTVRTYLKAVASIGPEAEDWIVSTGFAVLRPISDVEPRFLYRVVQSNPFVESVVAASTGVSYPAINPSTLGTIPVPLPDLPTQKAIADFLDRETARIDQLIEKKQRLVEVLGERTERLADVIVGQFADYPVTPLRRVLIRIEQGWSPECEAREKEDHEWGVLKVGCVNGWVFRSHEHKALPTSLSPRPDLEIKDGDVLMSRANTRELVGSVAIVSGSPKQLMLCDKLYRLRFDLRKVRPDFAVIALRSKTARQHYEARSNGASSSMQNIGQEAVRTLFVSLPPLEMQKIFAENFNLQLERQKRVSDTVEASINRLREFRAALITAAVTGQIDVATWGKRGEPDRRLDAIEREMAS